jgi:hypothetical protein
VNTTMEEYHRARDDYRYQHDEDVEHAKEDVIGFILILILMYIVYGILFQHIVLCILLISMINVMVAFALMQMSTVEFFFYATVWAYVLVYTLNYTLKWVNWELD